MQKKKDGQLQLSFGMIFSIIIIIATIMVAFYFIQKILAAQECTKIELFKSDMQDSIEKMWRSPFGSEKFISTLPAGIKKVCVGSVTLAPAMYSKVVEAVDPYLDPDENLMFYPPKEACSGRFAATKLMHIKDDSFICADAVKGKVSFTLLKGKAENLVLVQK